MKNSSKAVILIIILLAFAGVGLYLLTKSGSGGSDGGQKIAAKVYKTPTCGCCSNYIAYLKGRGFDVETVNMPDLTEIKQRYGVPSSLQSCHTTIIGESFVEGHMPVEAIRDFLADNEGSAGIALPGMPSGSPGMPGAKATFEIERISKEGTVSHFRTM